MEFLIIFFRYDEPNSKNVYILFYLHVKQLERYMTDIYEAK